MGYYSAKRTTSAARKPRDPLYVGCFRVLITDDPRLTPETPEEAQERRESAWFKRAGGEEFRETVQFFRGEGVTGIDFAPMTRREFRSFVDDKAWKYRFASERDDYGYAVVKLYRRPGLGVNNDV
jgi:hypothetical protein